MSFYYSKPDSTALYQGDVIQRTDKVEKILRELHIKKFEKTEYKYLQVVTQTCDLVRRNGNCKTRYITVSAVRPLLTVVSREIEHYLYDEIERKLKICDDSRKEKIKQFMERLLNNNEYRYFFLYRESRYGLEEDCCSFLQLTIPLLSEEHYSTLLEAKILQLNESFQHKLGYQLGELYSRIGTEDWLPGNTTADRFKEMINRPIEEVDEITWFEKGIYGRLKKLLKKVAIEELTIEKLSETLKQIEIEEKERVDEVERQLKSELTTLNIPDDTAARAVNSFKNNPHLSFIFK